MKENINNKESKNKVEKVDFKFNKKIKRSINVVAVILAVCLSVTSIHFLFANEINTPKEQSNITPVSEVAVSEDATEATITFKAEAKEGYKVNRIEIPELGLSSTDNPATFVVGTNGNYEVKVVYTKIKTSTPTPTVTSEEQQVEEVQPTEVTPVEEQPQEETPVVEPAQPVEETPAEVPAEQQVEQSVEEPQETTPAEENALSYLFMNVNAEESGDGEEYVETFTVEVTGIEEEPIATMSVARIPDAIDCLNFIKSYITTPGSKVYTFLNVDATKSINSTGANYGSLIRAALEDAGLVDSDSEYCYRIYKRINTRDFEIYWVNADINKLNVGDALHGWKMHVDGSITSFNTSVYLDGGLKAIDARAESVIETGVEDKCYTIDENGTITSYDSSACGVHVVIPSKVNNTDVTAIGDGAFQNKGITSVSFGAATSLTSIGSKAFANNKIVHTNIPTSISVATDAFDGQFVSISDVVNVEKVDGSYTVDMQVIADANSGVNINNIVNVKDAAYDASTKVATFSSNPVADEQIQISYDYDVQATSLDVTVAAPATAPEEDTEITYDLGSMGTIDGSSTKSYAFDPAEQKTLSEIGYPLGTMSNAGGSFSTSGEVVSSNGALLYWLDENNELVLPNTVPQDNATYHAFWLTDNDGDGKVDGGYVNFQITSVNAELSSLSLNANAKVTTTEDEDGNTVYTVGYNAIAAGGTSDAILNQIVGFGALRTNPAYIAPLANKIRPLINSIESEKHLSDALSAKPATADGSTPVSVSVNGTEMSEDEAYSLAVSSNAQYIYTYDEAPAYTLTLHLGDYGTFADGTNTKEIETENGLIDIDDYPLGTLSKSFSTSGDVISSNALLLAYYDQDGNAFNPFTEVTSDKDLYAYWAVDSDGDGIVDNSTRTFILQSTGEVNFTSNPTTINLATVTKDSDKQYTIVYSSIAQNKTTNDLVKQLVQYGPLRKNTAYATTINTITTQVKTSIENLGNVSLGTAISALPGNNISDVHGHAYLSNWTVDGQELNDTDVLTYEPTTSTATYVLSEIKNPDAITLTINLGSEGTFADGSSTKTIETVQGKTLTDLGVSLGTFSSANGFSTSGYVNSSTAGLLFYQYADGTFAAPNDVVNADTTLNAYWLKDTNGDGKEDRLEKSFTLNTNGLGTINAPSTTSNATATSDNGVYTITYSKLTASGTASIYNQMMASQFMGLRWNNLYFPIILNRWQPLLSIIDNDVTIGDAISAMPTTTGTGTNYFASWTNGTVSVSDEDALATSIASSDVTLTANFEKVVRHITVNYLYENGDSAATTYTTDVYDGESYEVESPAIQGYTADVEKVSGTANDDVTVTVTYTANADTKYEVNYYTENLDGTYSEVATSKLEGTTGTEVSAIENDYNGFTFDAANSVATGNVEADGSLVLNMYYTRNTYDVNYSWSGDVPNGHSLPVNTTAKYGEEITIADTQSQDGYTFTGWLINNQATTTYTVGASDVEISATWIANDNIAYHTEYYQQTLDGDYELALDEPSSGTTDTTANASVKEFAGFNYDANNTNNVLSGNINGNGSLVLKVYYTRKTDVAYTVEHYGLNTNNEYDLLGTDDMTGTYGATVSAVSNDYSDEGYTYNADDTNNALEGVVNAEGTLVLRVDYSISVYNSIPIKDISGLDIDVVTMSHGNEIVINDGETETRVAIDKDIATNGIELPEAAPKAGQDLDATTPWRVTTNENGEYVIEPVYVYNPKFVINYDLNGASGSVTPKEVTYIETGLLPRIPTRSGYNFTGWTYNGIRVNDLATFETLVGNDNSLEITLIANWDAIPVATTTEETTTVPVAAIPTEQVNFARPIATVENAEERTEELTDYTNNASTQSNNNSGTLIKPDYGHEEDSIDIHILGYLFAFLDLIALGILFKKKDDDKKEIEKLMNSGANTAE